MQDDQTTRLSPPSVEDVAARYVAGRQLTLEELAVIQNSRAATDEFVAIVKRMLAKESYPVRSLKI